MLVGIEIMGVNNASALLEEEKEEASTDNSKLFYVLWDS